MTADAVRRSACRRRLARLAEPQAGVLSRPQLYEVRIAADDFFAQIAQALVEAGWPGRHANRAS